MDASSAVTRFIAEHRTQIAAAWRAQGATITESAARTIVDHLHAFLVDRDPEHLHDWELEQIPALREALLTVLLAHGPDDPRGIVDVNRALDVALAEALQHAAHREELRERFVGILGHDLRNPLMALTLAAEAILATPCPQHTHARHALAIRNGGERMSRMIGAIVDFAHGQLGGGIPVAPRACDMGSLCREVVDELRATNPDRDIRLATAGQLAGSWDRDRVAQVISNLVANAIVHGEDPTTARVFETDDGNYVVTEIHNEGPPIGGDALEVLFDPFRRAKTKKSGLGLGLYIVQQITHAHGGRCTVASTPETGTTFTISWPRSESANIPEARGTRHASH